MVAIMMKEIQWLIRSATMDHTQCILLAAQRLYSLVFSSTSVYRHCWDSRQYSNGCVVSESSLLSYSLFLTDNIKYCIWDWTSWYELLCYWYSSTLYNARYSWSTRSPTDRERYVRDTCPCILLVQDLYNLFYSFIWGSTKRNINFFQTRRRNKRSVYKIW